MQYIVVVISLFLIEILYFKIADKYNIIDKPNDRSSHTTVTLRGGGVIFYIASLFFFIISSFAYPWFFLGLSMMTFVSFLDDVFTLSNKFRLIVHFSSVLLLAYELNVFELQWYLLFICFIIIVGVINAYNFMDGINGITACYSLSVCGLLILVNSHIEFIQQDLLIYLLISILVFSYFNFRSKARTFAGDVGSVSMAYILLFALGLLIIKTGNFIYFLFLSVYGVDTIWTIIRRLRISENIFKAHRSHLYQYLANEAGMNKLLVSAIYGLIQFLIGLLVIEFSDYSFQFQIWFAIILISLLSVSYVIIKYFVINRYVNVIRN